MNETISFVKSSTLPQIYLSNHENSLVVEWNSDCDCGVCVEQVGFEIPKLLFASTTETDSPLLDKPLKLADTLLIEPINDHFLILDLARGMLVVINQEGHKLLQAFRQPTTISNLLQNSASVSKNILTHYLHLLCRFDILHEMDAKPEVDIVSRPDTFTAWLHLTNQCNLRCTYCYINKSGQHMSADTAQDALENIFVTALTKGFHRIKLKYAGGEPTLTPDALMQTHLLAKEMAKDHHVVVEGNILTNGLAIPRRLVDFSLEHDLKWAISLDGLGNEHDHQRPLVNGRASSHRVLASIDKLQKQGISPFIPITLTRYNLTGLSALIEFLLERNLHFSLNFYRQSEYSLERTGLYPDNQNLIDTLSEAYQIIESNLPRYSLMALLLDRVNFKAPHLYPCGAGHSYMAVGQHGNVVPCQMLISQSSNKGFKNIAVTLKDGCAADCPWRYFCAGGCPVEAFQAYGQYTMVSPYCEVYRTLAPQVLRLEALRILRYEQPISL